MLLQAKLPLSLGVGDEPAALEGDAHHYRRPHELDEDWPSLTKRSRKSAPSAWQTAQSGPFAARWMLSAFTLPLSTFGKTANSTTKP